MPVSIAVTLKCDRRRVPGCHWRYDLGANPAPAAVAAGWRQAEELGWTTLRDDGAAAHLCPVCNGGQGAGADVRPLPAEAMPLPRTIGEAAERDRRRRTRQPGGESSLVGVGLYTAALAPRAAARSP